MPPAAAAPYSGALQWFARHRGLIFPLGVVASVLVILVPMPPALLDLLLAGNITLAVVVLLTTVYVRTPLDFSVFPSLLLTTTLVRLVLNVASTRLILTRGGEHGVLAAGGVIRGFGEFVAGDRVAVGLILFVIIVVIQFVVITKGATRISEVAARFALDGMPGRQMAIDADLNAGLIDENEARRRRQEITQQADFYGAMDGASKFVRGDAIAGIIITLINVLGGLYIGVAESGMSFGEAIDVFTRLTIGDGLVTQVPAFLISLAAGLIATRSTTATDLPRDVLGQVFSHPEALFVAATFLGFLVFTRLPRLPLTLLGASCGGIAYLLVRGRAQLQRDEAERRRTEQKQQQQPKERVEDYLHVDPMEVEIGYGLIRLADRSKGGDLLERVQRVRQQVAQELGIILPKVRIRDNVRLEPREYRIKIRDVPVARGELYPDHHLAMDAGMARGKVEGIETREPAFGMPAVWVERSNRERAEMLGYTVVQPSSVMATHLTEVIRKHADELLTRDQVKRLLDGLKEESPAVVDELVPGLLKPGDVQKVLKQLLRERVPIRNLELILEALGDYAPRTKDPEILNEYVRHALSRVICQQYRDEEGTLRVITLEPAVEDFVAAGVEHTDRGMLIKMSPQSIEKLVRAIGQEIKKLTDAGRPPVVLCGPEIRAAVKRITAATLSKLAVLSYNEVTRDTKVESVAMVGLPAGTAAPVANRNA